MSLSRGLVVGAALAVAACSSPSFEYRKASDGHEIAVVRDLDDLLPMFAVTTNVTVNVSVTDPTGKGGTIGGSVQQQLTQLYDRLDNLNGQVRNFLVLYYNVYVNAELTSDADERKALRTNWLTLVTALQNLAMKVRTVQLLASSLASSTTNVDIAAVIKTALDEIKAAEDDFRASVKQAQKDLTTLAP